MLLKRSMLKPHKALCSTNIFAAAISPLGTSLHMNQPWITKAAHRWCTQSNTDAALAYLLHHFNGSKSFISVLTGFPILSRGPQNSTTKRTTRDYSKKIGTAAKLIRWTKIFVDTGTAMPYIFKYRCEMQRPPPPIPVPESHLVSGLKPLL